MKSRGNHTVFRRRVETDGRERGIGREEGREGGRRQNRKLGDKDGEREK